jgi:hypothetical protein
LSKFLRPHKGAQICAPFEPFIGCVAAGKPDMVVLCIVSTRVRTFAHPLSLFFRLGGREAGMVDANWRGLPARFSA